MSKVAKTIQYIVALLLAVFSLQMTIASAVMMMEAEDYGIMMFVLFLFTTLISVGEIVRIKKNKNHIILPMIGMFMVAIVIAFEIEFVKETIQGDRSALGPAITFGIMVLLLVISGYGIHKGISGKPKTGSEVTNDMPMWRFVSFNAEWLWDEVKHEFTELLLEKMTKDERSRIQDPEAFFFEYLENNPETDYQIYIYACNEFAYLFLWLVKRNGVNKEEFRTHLGGEWSEEFKALEAYKKNPAEFIYSDMDGRVYRSDIEPIYAGFLDSYYERSYLDLFTKQEVIRDVSYGKDYEEIVLKSNEGLDGPVYCRDFNFEKYEIFEERLSQRFEEYRRNSADLTENMETYKEDFYSYALDKKMEVTLQRELVFDDEKEELYRYADKCLAEINHMPENLLWEICEEFNAWGEDWIPEGDKLTPDLFKERTSPGEVQIFKPYGKELAYNLCFEADFEPEHGIYVAMKDGHIMESGYRMDAGSPWCDEIMGRNSKKAN